MSFYITSYAPILVGNLRGRICDLPGFYLDALARELRLARKARYAAWQKGNRARGRKSS